MAKRKVLKCRRLVNFLCISSLQVYPCLPSVVQQEAEDPDPEDFEQHSESSEIDIEDRTQSPCFLRPDDNISSYYGSATGGLGRPENRGLISSSIASSIRPISAGQGRKPRRRRTAFTHAQLAFLERKFRWERLKTASRINFD